MSPRKLGLPDLPDNLPWNLREWCEAVQSQLVVLADAKDQRSGERAPTVDELIAAGVTNAENLKET